VSGGNGAPVGRVRRSPPLKGVIFAPPAGLCWAKDAKGAKAMPRRPSAGRSQEALSRHMLRASTDSQKVTSRHGGPTSPQSGPPLPDGHPHPRKKGRRGLVEPARRDGGGFCFRMEGAWVSRTGLASLPSALAALRPLATAVGRGRQPLAGGCRWPGAAGPSGWSRVGTPALPPRLPDGATLASLSALLAPQREKRATSRGDGKRQRPQPLPHALR